MRPVYIFEHVSLSPSYNETCFRKKSCREHQENIFYVQ